MTPKVLRSFMTIVTTGSFNQAAARLRLTQPALSRQIRQLEDELGVVLLERHGRGVTLTDKGAILRDHADGLLRHIEQVRLELTSHASVPAGTLAIGFPPPLRALVSDPLIEIFHERYDLVKLQVYDNPPHLIRELILSGVIELGVVSSIESSMGLVCEPLVTENLFVAGAPAAALAVDRPLSAECLLDIPLVQAGTQGAVRVMINRRFSGSERQPQFNVEVDSMDLMIDRAASGRSFTVLPYSALARSLEAGRISAAPLADFQIGWVLARLAERQVSVAAQRMIDVTRQLIDDHLAGGGWRTASRRTAD